MSAGRIRRQGVRADDRGVALLTVVGSMMVLSLFLLVGLNTAIRSMSSSRSFQDGDTATAAAQSGASDFVQQLNLNINYLNDVGMNTWSTYRAVQGTNGASTAMYRYKILSVTGGQVLLQIEAYSGSTGTDSSAAVHQTLYATVQARSFLSYVYFSDIEVIDPVLANDPAACANYYYAGRSSRNDCAEIQWAGGDVVNGPLHSNDALQINGAVQFRSNTTTTAWPAANGRTGLTNASKTWWGTQNAPLPAYPPHYDTALTLPDTNTSLLDYVQPNVNAGSNTTRPGCYYQGATRIVFSGTTMKVLSPSTTRADTPTRCYNRLTPSVEQTVAIPSVIYVDAGTATCALRNTGYPLSNEVYTTASDSATNWGYGPNYSCKRGTAYIQGVVDTGVTVTSADDTVITGNLTVQSTASSSTDVIGIIAGNYVWVYHPLKSGGNNILTTTAQTNPPAQQVNTIQAGILSLAHSFVVQNWNDGNTLGSLNLSGAIGQKFRGPVGTSSNGSPVSGYLKNYVYDDRLSYLHPPYFLDPSVDDWTLTKTVAKGRR